MQRRVGDERVRSDGRPVTNQYAERCESGFGIAASCFGLVAICASPSGWPLDSVRLLNNAEEVSVRILEDDEVGSRLITPGISDGPQPDQSLDLGFLLIGVQVEVQPAAPLRACLSRLEREVRALPRRIAKNRPTVARRFAWHVLQGMLPECHHAIEFAAMHHNRADFHGYKALNPPAGDAD
jgi:hypothetical protein